MLTCGNCGRESPDDFAFCDLVIAMDRDNADDLERLRGGEESNGNSKSC